ncbi:cathepsin B-like cysteine proteinase 4 [Daktulosphaira vitifoliae]|uniref:cathepsin B-like cysteine proteinase 4 n=1 Tax=Daktulosphaira vitifoliae TaxID=58002 RepID=UPI0021A978EF|nr:cathepsin B-like cysteine proteinase 4 [Daktulosphaira vitifoliae]
MIINMKNKTYVGFCLIIYFTFSSSLIFEKPDNKLDVYKSHVHLESSQSRLIYEKTEKNNVSNSRLDKNENFLPKYFDARKKWPKCRSIGVVRYQSNCNSDWAIAAAGVFSDRLCIKSNGYIVVNVSAEHILACAKYNGCSGGEPKDAWNFLKTKGAVTGGDYGTYEGCQPYEILPCGSSGYPKCRKTEADTPICYGYCTNTYYRKRFVDDKNWARDRYVTFLPINEMTIMNEIIYNGSVQCVFDGYKDLLYHVSGVYVKKSNEYIARHSVKIIGWGTENNQPYWLMVNSWGQRWAEQGLFKMARNTLITLYGNITAGYV